MTKHMKPNQNTKPQYDQDQQGNAKKVTGRDQSQESSRKEPQDYNNTPKQSRQGGTERRDSIVTGQQRSHAADKQPVNLKAGKTGHSTSSVQQKKSAPKNTNW